MKERHLVDNHGPLSSDLHHAAVDRDLSAGNKAALVACKEESCGGDLLGAGEASERNEAAERLAHLVAYVREHGCIGRARTFDVDADAPGRQPVRPDSSEGAD